MEEYRIDLKVRNNIILKKLEEAGYKTLGEFCRLNNMINQTAKLGAIINMKRSPLLVSGIFVQALIKMADILGCAPEDLFTDIQMNTALKTNKRSIEVNEAEMKFMLESRNNTKMIEDILDEEKRDSKIYEMLNTLTPREKKVLDMRFGLGDEDPHTLEQCANKFDVNRERIRQIEAVALRKLRHHSRHKEILQFLPGEI